MTKKRSSLTEPMMPAWLTPGGGPLLPAAATTNLAAVNRPLRGSGAPAFSVRQRAEHKRVQSFANRRRNK